MRLPTEKFWAVVDAIQHKDWWLSAEVGITGTRMRWAFEAPCSRTGVESVWYGRWWDVTDMTEEQLVKTAFAALKLAIEHETMEAFKYKGVAIFDPHTPLAALMAAQE
jgi:hypothetical protein